MRNKKGLHTRKSASLIMLSLIAAILILLVCLRFGIIDTSKLEIKQVNEQESEEYSDGISKISQIAGRAIIDMGEFASKGNGYIIFVLMFSASLLFSIIFLLNMINTKAAENEKYNKLKGWVDHAYARGHEHDKIKDMLLRHGWDENLIERAIEDHKEDIEDKKYNIDLR